MDRVYKSNWLPNILYVIVFQLYDICEQKYKDAYKVYNCYIFELRLTFTNN